MEPNTINELPACPVETTLTLISDKWKVLILRDLMPGTKRFGELKKSIGHVTQKVLTAQLRQMEESGLLTRKVYAEVPPRVIPSPNWATASSPSWTPCGSGAKATRTARTTRPNNAVFGQKLRVFPFFFWNSLVE